MKKTKIKKVVIELNGIDVELTLEQAKELQLALNELFEEKQVVVKEKEREYVPYPVPYERPAYIKPWRYVRDPWSVPVVTWDISCGTAYKTHAGTNVLQSGNSLKLALNS